MEVKDEFNNQLEEGFKNQPGLIFNAEGDLYDRVPASTAVINLTMQAAWFGSYSGKPWLTQNYTREIMNRYYGFHPLHGWLGDEDEGQMGAWYADGCCQDCLKQMAALRVRDHFTLK